MDKKSDFAIREHIAAAKKEIKQLIAEYAWLDNADRILLKIQNIKEVELAIETYVTRLKQILQKFLGDNIIEKVGEEAFNDVVKKLKKYIESGQLSLDYANRAEIIRGALGSLARQENTAIDAMRRNLKSKIANFSLLTKQKLNQVKKLIDTTAQQTLSRTFDYKIESEKDLKRYWKLLTKKYGTTATVTYADGKQFPVTSYLDMRARTNSELVHSAVTEAIAVGSEIYFGKISAHNTKDSCIYWEDKIIFYNDVLKKSFLSKYPELSKIVGNYATVDDVRRDRTHMFSYNCRHTIMPYPLHLFGYDEMVAELRANKMPVIPSKIPLEFKRAG